MNTDAAGSSKPVTRLAICGSGLALRMAAAALVRHLPPSMQMLCINVEDAPASDLFLGSVTAPSAYAFNLLAGVTEPRLLLDTVTAFSWGTIYSNWGGAGRAWAQCFHLPLPVSGGVQFHHYLARQGVSELEPYLMSAVAARHGVFAHPLEKGAQPLARGEYGYQFDASSYQAPFATAAMAGKLQVIASKRVDVETGPEGIAGLRLADGQVVRADLYIDCSGPQALLLSRLEGGFTGGRRLRAMMTRREARELGAPCRKVTGGVYGWQSDTPLQGTTARLTVFAPESEALALAAHAGEPQVVSDVRLGRHARPWSGNCVGMGQAAGVLEPITHAPMLLLQRDIERFASLIPFSTDMSMERREYNRQCGEDYSHAEIFNRAFFETAPLGDSEYWSAARAEPVPEKLAVKIGQFASRGLLVAFDLEPFNPEDWTILHHGMGRLPARHDRVADRASDQDVKLLLENRRRDIEKVVSVMPSHHRYVTQLAQHLRQRNL
jgi:tryptophan 7-halogenase